MTDPAPTQASASRELRPIAFAAFVGTMAIMAFVAVIGPIVRQLGLAEWHAGLAIAVAGLLWMLLARSWGAASDRRGRKPILLLGLGATGGIYVLLALFVDVALRNPPTVLVSVVLLVLARGLIGAFYAAVPPTAAAIVADRMPPSERTGAMAKLGAANATGLVVGPAAAGWLAGFGLQWPLYAAAMLPLLAMLVVWKTLSRGPQPAQRPDRPGIRLLDSRLRLPLATALVALVSISAAQVTIGFFALDRLGLPPAEAARAAGRALTAVGFGLIASQALVMRLRGVAPRRWLAIGASLAALGFGSVALVHALPGLLGAYTLAAFGMGMVMPAFQSSAANAVEPHEQGAAAGTVAAAQGMGVVLGPLLATGLYRLSPAAPYVAVGVLLALLAGWTLLSRPAPNAEPAIP